MSILSTLKDAVFGSRDNSAEIRHRPSWFPSHSFDKRWIGERFAVMTIAPYKPPYRRHVKLKAWVCAGPGYIFRVNAIIELDLDERSLDVDLYR